MGKTLSELRGLARAHVADGKSHLSVCNRGYAAVRITLADGESEVFRVDELVDEWADLCVDYFRVLEGRAKVTDQVGETEEKPYTGECEYCEGVDDCILLDGKWACMECIHSRIDELKSQLAIHSPHRLVEVSWLENADGQKLYPPARNAIQKSKTGRFHGWGSDYEEFENVPGNYTVGIVEYDDGTVELVHPHNLKFKRT
jgi:hypothetical protein